MAQIEEIVKTPPIRLQPTAHFMIRAIQRGIDDLSGLSALLGKLCQTKIGEEVAVKVGEHVFVAVRTKSDEAVLKTVYKRK